MENDAILKEENINFTDGAMEISGKKIALCDIESVFLTEENPAKERAYVFVAIGVILIIFTSRWFMAGGVLAILAGIVTFFDSRRKFTIYINKKGKDEAVYAGYDFAKTKKIKAILSEKLNP